MSVREPQEKSLRHYRLNLPPGLCEQADAAFAGFGMTRRNGCERLIGWFVAQPDFVQQLALRQLARDLRPRAMAGLVAGLIETWRVGPEEFANALESEFGEALAGVLARRGTPAPAKRPGARRRSTRGTGPTG